jgi:hypothetical protein
MLYHIRCSISAVHSDASSLLYDHHEYSSQHASTVTPLVCAQLRAAVSSVGRLKYCAACRVACSLSQSSIPYVTPTISPVYRYSIILANPSAVKSLPVSVTCTVVDNV